MTKRKSLAQFIRENKQEIDSCIRSQCPGLRLNNEERESWIMNDEGLYLWAQSEGVRV